MKKEDLEKRVKELERKVDELQSRPVYVPTPVIFPVPAPAPIQVPNPYPLYPTITCRTINVCDDGQYVWN